MNKQEQVIGYVMDENDMYRNKYYFEGTPTKIASFIMSNQYQKVVITDLMDNLILNTMVGGFVDYCPRQKFLQKDLLPVLIPMQMGEINPEVLVFEAAEDGDCKETTTEMEYKL